MSSPYTPPANFTLWNNQASKNMNIVVDIDGLALLSSTQVMRHLEYGDPASYGDAGLEYGGLNTVPIGTQIGERQQKNILSLDGGSFTISQMLEPEQGRGSISTISMTFIDKDSYMTQAVSQGIIVPEILGRQVRIWIGYAPTSWPQDYYVVWRGRVGQVNAEVGKVTLQFVDPNIIRRQQVFYCGVNSLSADIDNMVTTIPVNSNANFFEKITGPGGSYDTTVRTFIKIDDEFMEYQQAGSEGSGYGANQFVNVVRGVSPVTNMATPSVAASHTSGTEVDGYIMFTGNALDLALKIMLSGWGGPYKTGQAIHSLGLTDDYPVIVSNAIVLPSDVDAVRDLGVSIGDYVTVAGDSHSANNGTFVVNGFDDTSRQSNGMILVNTTFINSDPSAATISIRSQYDVYPTGAGCVLPGWEVDIWTFQYYRNTFLANANNQMQFLLSGPETGKTFIESELLLPLGAYSLTRQGKISMGLTKPPIADSRSQTLSAANVIEPTSIVVSRGLNNRKFFNEIDWSFDCDETNTATSQRHSIDEGSIALFGIVSALPISSRGARTNLGFLNVVSGRETWLFNRYKNAAVLVDLKTNLQVGNQIEVGDIVVLNDSGGLQLPNFTTGIRNFGIQLMEVINRSLDLKTGIVQLKIEGGVGNVTDRYATVAPSSILASGNTSSRVIITDSFGAIFPANEQKKWTPYFGLKVRIHSPDFLVDGTTVMTGMDAANNYAILLAPALAFTPQPGYIMDLAQYPTNATPSDQAMAKLIHGFVDPSVAVVSGTSNTVFTVGGGDIGKFAVGQIILLHNVTWGVASGEVTITAINSNTLTVSASLTFVPDASFKVELIGFADGGYPYRMV